MSMVIGILAGIVFICTAFIEKPAYCETEEEN